MTKSEKYRSWPARLAYLMIMLAFSACSDYLELTPTNRVTDNIVWNSTSNADKFLNNIYAGLPREYNNADPVDNFSDDAFAGPPNQYSRTTFALANYTSNDAPNYWSSSYSNIRKCNLFIDNMKESKLSTDWKTLRTAEVRFLRAYYYHILWMNYGGVPIITDVLNQSEQGDAIYRARNTHAETFNFIIEELESIVQDLPLKSEAGRATRGAALTLKGWCELFEASALNNPGNDQSKWKSAAETNKQVIESGVYSLFPNFQSMFYEENNNNVEEIFSRQYLGGTALGGSREGLTGPFNVGGESKSFGGVRPTHNIVQEFFMANGLPITDPASGYDPNAPYLNREKRFYYTVSFDGAEWLGTKMVYRVGSGSLIEFNRGSPTGYDLVKGMNPKYAVHNDQKLNSASQKYFRYAEVLLNFAEAQNEVSGPIASVYDALNQIRKRVDLPPLKAGLSQDAMRKAIHQERRVELAFEQKRYLDLLRWKTAEVVLNQNLLGMKIENGGKGTIATVVPVAGGQRLFYPEKNYLLPIPQSSIDKNSQLKQNPNY
ncbi:RagB/SusD family nutrient uptake outer membrane protein [Dyadobacter sp. CY323]|uniref:RagB/SusD family nutrient uptake outer membrane protein n=1 Tax=Dyadobacter sp. CY323 TaxID=2907302 RepID=UPI001F3A9DDC|nr:RagB/SusD family nutrient uptake outer membrane protein [Dyadobacter sp. CY323]MCE6989870.1 RagB/SusD family nutrient uptake outer membrane protein [Dyadobacter sp. CY323]